MQWTMNENSLFAILLRSSFVWSFAIAAVLIAVMVAVLPEAYRIAAFVSGLPFIAIGCMAAWRQLQAPSQARIARTVEATRAMSSGEFKDALAEGYRREGYEVRPGEGAADLELAKEWRRTLVSCRRWKAGNTGVEPLRDLVKAKEAREAHECVYVALGEVSGNAREFAQQHGVKIAGPAELARLVTIPKGTRKAALSR
ncbi:MAG: restriction endonuclease [Burkholderiales bacterium]